MSNSKEVPMSSEIKKLIRKRDLLKKSIAQIQTYADQYDPTTKSINQIQTRLDKLVKLMSDYEVVHNAIEDCDDVDPLLLDDAITVDDQFCSLKAQLLDILQGHSKVSPDTSTSQVPTVIRDSMKLPAIPAPRFDGNLQNWVSFFDTFNAMFHDNPGLSDVQRLHYLKSCLSGPAADVIKTIPTTDGNYHTAYEALVERYKNNSLIIQSHIRSLMDTPAVQRPSASALRNLHHHIVSHVRALRAMNLSVDSWDPWLVTLVCSRLDPTTAGEWQLMQTSRELPKFIDLERFLASRVSAYEVGEVGKQYEDLKQLGSGGRPLAKKVFLANTTESNALRSVQCKICGGAHRLYTCERFTAMSLTERKDLVFKFKLCYNCLCPGHQVQHCRSSNCHKCGKRHNTKLHDESLERPIVANPVVSSNSPTSTSSSVVAYIEQSVVPSKQTAATNQVMLATSIILIKDLAGQDIKCRAVLDSGSQVCLITDRLANMLKLNKRKGSLSICGVGATSTHANTVVHTTILSRFGDYIAPINFHVINNITNNLPIHPVDINDIQIPSTVSDRLADPEFHIPSSIDILLGAEIFFELFIGERIKIVDHIAFYNTSLGWVFTGSVPINTLHTPNSLLHCTKVSSLTLTTVPPKSTCHLNAEEHFRSNVSVDHTGRFIVRLPFIKDPSTLGDSRFMAQQRFYNLERKLIKNPSLAEEYKEFMNEYLQMGHMELAERTDKPSYYLPHHAVFKSSSLTTKMRVVFDGSAPARSGYSLNDILVCGPTVQPDLLSIVLRFRIHKIALTADVAKMYRQIRVAPEDCDMQRICYRSSPDEPLKDYRLLTVTYGTRSASFLATRCLLELSYNVTDQATRRSIQQDFYVDDLLSGCHDEAECYKLYQNLSTELNKAGFPLRKWCSNSNSIMSKITNPERSSAYLLSISEEETVSTLGLAWQPSSDCFRYIFKPWSPHLRITKRSLLSDINSVFDPIGFLSPVLITGKIFIQQLWQLKLNWDTALPDDMQNKWVQFYNSLKILQQLSIPRCVPFDDAAAVQLHGFCDASQNAYGACVYMRSTTTHQCRLYVSKSRVAPLKPSTIPRLELCGALLLAELINMVINELVKLNININPNNIILWTDSTIVLAWISTEKPLKSYVSNRIAQILDITSSKQWRHVPTSSNPADIISRGCPANTIIQSELWWYGPQWLQLQDASWPSYSSIPSEIPETREIKSVLITTNNDALWLFQKYSNWIRLIRITAWLFRFIQNCRIKNNSAPYHVGSLTVSELQNAQVTWLKYAQLEFSEDLKALQKNQMVSHKSSLKLLNPFIDQNGLIRVGGRLARSSHSQCHKFPIVLPSKHRLTRMIFTHEHLRLLHAGPQALLASLQMRYWPLKGRLIARTTVHKCNICFRFKPKFTFPLMAPLPRERTTIERPFNRCGVDFCGPILIKSGLRRVAAIKSYVSIFVCFVTRAVHLELVTNLTADAFLAAMNRFISRRGTCEHIHSDNATNFVGANRILRQYLQKTIKNSSVIDELANRGIQWHFIPPATPHFGGLWEAAVKSAKHHLLRTTKGILLSFEELNTLLCQVEVILNSRPMTPLSNDPSDHEALTPNHFLLGGPVTLPQTPDITNVPKNRLHRFELMRAQMQTFWKRWSKEYLPQLHQRGRWTTKKNNIQVGSLAILKEDNLPPLQWKLVRITAVHPGADGVVRVVTVRSSHGVEMRRPVVKVAILPYEEEANEDDF